MGLEICQTQYPWAQPHAEPKQIYVLRSVRPNVLRLSYALSSNIHESVRGFGKLLDPSPLGLTSFQVQVGMSLMLGDGVLFVHSCGF
jgi:hypothetical protein